MHRKRDMVAEKSTAALNSVIAAVGLTVTKVFVGLITGSLGILAEAAHSGLDLIAAIMTFFAVRISDRPPDSTHRYGHGKVENLSALFETLLLLITCAWIIYEAIHRLLAGNIGITVRWWSYAVIVLSIIVDISRSRMLYRAARKYNSQALEADAFHFSTDIWSSSVVLLGLICVNLSEFLPQVSFLKGSDAIAALAVAAIVIMVSVKLGLRAIHVLIDATPKGMEERIIDAVEALPKVINCHNVRIRYSGAQLFTDIHILTDGNASLGEIHALTEEVELRIRAIVPNADVTVHPEPDSS
jgi:cation diffusion facilitator family transporter